MYSTNRKTNLEAAKDATEGRDKSPALQTLREGLKRVEEGAAPRAVTSDAMNTQEHHLMGYPPSLAPPTPPVPARCLVTMQILHVPSRVSRLATPHLTVHTDTRLKLRSLQRITGKDKATADLINNNNRVIIMVDPSHAFHIADYGVFAATIVISIVIGIFYAVSGGRQRTTTEYLVGGRTMQFIPVAISLMVSFESSIMMLGLPAEMYVYGVQWWISCVGFMISQILSVIIMVPLLHPLKITSAYEYLHLRFNSTAVRLLGTFLGMLTYTWYMGIVLFGPAIALEAVTGFPQWSSIFVIALVAVIYTSIGGLKAVIWTDVFQCFVMYAGMISILVKVYSLSSVRRVPLTLEGPAKVWDIAREGGRLQFFNGGSVGVCVCVSSSTQV
ncbi:hypothetical protein C0Q70_20872 [Pomacea canaliculata]|uniref:Sodium-dependent multivitamin transporter n=1 Tax=Pomacea canaliculata TaxID=400727 RepID=A0A2T7NAX2_POMCA|nr:hypothetical protein C0Q70_20872 [Pomacea canaliculata]